MVMDPTTVKAYAEGLAGHIKTGRTAATYFKLMMHTEQDKNKIIVMASRMMNGRGKQNGRNGNRTKASK